MAKRYDLNKPNKQKKPKSINKYDISGSIIIICFFSVFLGVGGYILLSYLLKAKGFDDTTAGIVGGAFSLAALIAITIAIIHIVKQIRHRQSEKRVIKNGDIVTAIISNYAYTLKTKRSSNRTYTYYVVKFDYTYTLRDISVTKTFGKTFNDLPDFKEGGRLAIAVDGDNVVILDGYVPHNVSSREFDEMANADFDALFAGLDGRQIDEKDLNITDYAKKHTGEYAFTRRIAGIALLVFYSIIIIPLMIFIPLNVHLIPGLIFSGIMLAATLPILILALSLLIGGIKSTKKQQRVFKDCRYTTANYNFSTGVYSSTKTPTHNFCFIDYRGNKRIYKINSLAAKLMQGNYSHRAVADKNSPLNTVVAYNDDEAILLTNCYYSRSDGFEGYSNYEEWWDKCGGFAKGYNEDGEPIENENNESAENAKNGESAENSN